MPFANDKQRRLFYAAANKKGGVKDLDQETAKKFIEDSKAERFKKLKDKLKGTK